MQIQKIFKEIRNAVNEREDQLLLDADNKFEEFFLKKILLKKVKNCLVKLNYL